MKRVRKLILTNGAKINTIWVDYTDSTYIVDFQYIKAAYDSGSKKYTFMADNNRFQKRS